MPGTVRLGLLFLMLGIIYKLAPCSGYSYSIDVYVPADDEPVEKVDYYASELRQGCYNAAWGWWIFSFPAVNGTCFPNYQNCTTSGGVTFWQPSQPCSGSDVCCVNPANATAPPTVPSFFPGGGLGNCTPPAYNASNVGSIFTPWNCTFPTIPSLPTGMPTLPGVGIPTGMPTSMPGTYDSE